MTNRFWHLTNPDGTGTGNVVQPQMDYWPAGTEKQFPENWNLHLIGRPVTHHCDPSNPVGWIEGEEVYQVRIRKCMDWLNAQKEIYDKWLTDGAKEDLRRIWIEPKREQPLTPEEIFENLMLPLKKSLSEESWNFLISRGQIFIKQTAEINNQK